VGAAFFFAAFVVVFEGIAPRVTLARAVWTVEVESSREIELGPPA
jgi:hypothetical protein